MEILFLLIIAYLLGSIQTGLWIGKFFYHKNLRDYGSGNTGTTNTFRVLGAKAGSVTFIVDILKGTIATLLPVLLGITGVSPLIFGFFTILGHIYPIFSGFKGGKAVATSAGVLLGYSPLFLLFLLSIFAIVLYLYSMISLSSVVAAAVAVIGVLTFPAFGFLLHGYDWFFTIIIIIMATLIIVRHIDNMKRIKERNENLVPFGLNLSHQKK